MYIIESGDMIKDFLEHLSYRRRNENDLSDVTWAMCNASPKFKEFFLNFFFSDIKVNEDTRIEREVSEDNSRADFVIYNGDDKYLIENKVYDGNHHFGEYDSTFGVTPARFGYIANYTITQPKSGVSYQIRRWDDLYNKLGKIDLDNEDEKELIEGYRLYLKSVCHIVTFTKPMNIEGIYSLYELIETFGVLCERKTDHFELKEYNRNRYYDNSHSDHTATGVNFHVKFAGCRLEAYGWIGIFFNEEEPTIYMGFYDYKGWGKPICDLLKKNNYSVSDNPSLFELCDHSDDDDACWFTYIDGYDKYEDHFNQLPIEEQKAQLQLFMDSVLEYIYKLKTVIKIKDK